MTGDIKQFNFYKRYRWTAQDFTDFQSYLLNFSRGVQEGLLSAAVIDGYGVAPSGSGLAVDIGLALGPTGYLHVNTIAAFVTVPTAVSNPRRDLIVARPLLVDETLITKPTNPLEQVYLKQNLQSQIIRIAGTEAASPTYPATQANDTILAGVAIKVGAASFAVSDLDFEVKDMMGKNSNFQNFTAKYDDRCRPYRSTNTILGIKPSQLSNPKAFVYVNKGVQSKFPLSSGVFNNSDATVNFTTGVIGGGDQTSASFTPTIPSTNNYIVATISLKNDDTLSVVFGTQGTKAQCYTGIENATTVGAGSLSLPGNVMRIAYVILGSINGTSINSMDVVDARTSFSFGGPDNAKAYPNVFLSGSGAGDVTTLAAAIAALPAGGGVICLMDAVTVPTNATLGSRTKILGRGKNAVMTLSAGVKINMGTYCEIQNLKMSLGTGASGAITADFCNIYESEFVAASGDATAVCVGVRGNGCHLESNIFEGVKDAALAVGIQYDAGFADNSEDNSVFLA